MRFKGNSEALRKQLLSPEFNRHLREIIYCFAGYWVNALGKPMVITCVGRDPIRQVEWCQKSNYKSYFEHPAWEAVDIRSRGLTDMEIQVVLELYSWLFRDNCHLAYHEKKDPKNPKRYLIYPHFHLTTRGDIRRQDKICQIVENTPGASACFAG